VRVRGPRNHFPLVASSRYLFIAGGIGITPVLPMIAEAEAAGADWRLFYGGRERASMAFIEELARYGDRVIIVPQDEQGMLDLESSSACPNTTHWFTVAAPRVCSLPSKSSAKVAAGLTSPERFSQAAGTVCAVDSAFELVLQRPA
jgi:ferredoxin-NADP reductase